MVCRLRESIRGQRLIGTQPARQRRHPPKYSPLPPIYASANVAAPRYKITPQPRQSGQHRNRGASDRPNPTRTRLHRPATAQRKRFGRGALLRAHGGCRSPPPPPQGRKIFRPAIAQRKRLVGARCYAPAADVAALRPRRGRKNLSPRGEDGAGARLASSHLTLTSIRVRAYS